TAAGNVANQRMMVGDPVTKDVASVAYPNPAREWVKINAGRRGEYYLSDLQGKVIKTGRVEAGVNTINISGQTPGVYFIRVNEQAFKVVVQ
ncbi:MAG TPA: T9SS type A sorting domain-containing protein, partial [Chitinophaga sp.]